MAHVRERPPLFESIEVTTPAGKRSRWGEDESQAKNVPSGVRSSDTMPGGFESFDAVLPRKPGTGYSDIEPLSQVRRLDASGDVIWEGRLERAPRASGDQVAISPSAVGYQAHLDDNKSAMMVYVDRDIQSWREPTIERKAQYGANVDQLITTDVGSELAHSFSPEPIPQFSVSEVRYVAPAGAPVKLIVYQGVNTTVHANVEAATLFGSTSHLNTSGLSTALTLDDTVRFATLSATREQLFLRGFWSGIAATPTAGSIRRYKKLAVYGDHGLDSQPVTGETDGYLASDIVAHAVGQWAPLLQVTTGSIQASSFVIPHLTFPEPTTASEIIRQASRFGLEPWGVWEDRTFYWGVDRGRRWRARIGPAQLEETGPQVDRLWESVIVQYQDVDGSTKTVGPAGSGADTETDDLKDDDPENPANKLGITRRALLTMGVSTAAGATEIGRRFLEESKQLDSSGRATLTGYVEDDRGVLQPYTRVRAGDTISFVDAADTSYRRIVRAEKTRADRTCSIDLDAPPEGLQALLERLGVVLVPLGI